VALEVSRDQSQQPHDAETDAALDVMRPHATQITINTMGTKVLTDIATSGRVTATDRVTRE